MKWKRRSMAISEIREKGETFFTHISCRWRLRSVGSCRCQEDTIHKLHKLPYGWSHTTLALANRWTTQSTRAWKMFCCGFSQVAQHGSEMPQKASMEKCLFQLDNQESLHATCFLCICAWCLTLNWYATTDLSIFSSDHMVDIWAKTYSIPLF